jgi:hypothetical protein
MLSGTSLPLKRSAGEICVFLTSSLCVNMQLSNSVPHRQQRLREPIFVFTNDVRGDGFHRSNNNSLCQLSSYCSTLHTTAIPGTEGTDPYSLSGSQVLIVLASNSNIFREVMPCSPVKSIVCRVFTHSSVFHNLFFAMRKRCHERKIRTPKTPTFGYPN